MVHSSLAKKADEAYRYFEKATRTSNGAEFWRVKDGAPEWVQELCFAAHDAGDIFPDDWRYHFIVEALAAPSEEGEDDTEADIWTSDLCAWLASNLNRGSYVDDAVSEDGGGVPRGAQAAPKRATPPDTADVVHTATDPPR